VLSAKKLLNNVGSNEARAAGDKESHRLA
jgi:hypothetical protein